MTRGDDDASTLPAIPNTCFLLPRLGVSMGVLRADSSPMSHDGARLPAKKHGGLKWLATKRDSHYK